MEFFQRAKAVRLKSRHDKYLVAEDDEHHVTQDRNGSSPDARWFVEPVPVSVAGEAAHFLRLRSRYGGYLTASNEPFLLGMTGRKVFQTIPDRFDSSIEWEPIGEGFQVKLKTRYGNYLRANGGLPPWRNSVTHDVPSRTTTQDWVLWDVEIIEVAPASSPSPATKPSMVDSRPTRSSSGPNLESSESFSAPPHKVEGRAIYYVVADDDGNVEGGFEGHSLTFNGTSLEELTHKLQEETELSNIIICSRNPLNNKLYPLRLQLPPNNATMHVVVVLESSKVAKSFQ
ncbi:uncharacterized protein [Typha latifolia]|uniref:uncharacterized protein n=1 Tax=Typha latifolia TaxID=4733 RepID=UPI003C2E149C